MKRVFHGKNIKCPFKCLYCFTNENYDSYPDIHDEELLAADIIQPFCDYEIFVQRDYFNEIYKYVKYNKIISFATKSIITDTIADNLKIIDEELKKHGAFLHIGISITKINDYRDVEPYAPDPIKRIESVDKLVSRGIAVTLFLRPLLPNITNDELELVLSRLSNKVSNVVYGPLYINAKIIEYFKKNKIDYKYIDHVARWQNGQPTKKIVESEVVVENLITLCKKYNCKLLTSNEEAIGNIRGT